MAENTNDTTQEQGGEDQAPVQADEQAQSSRKKAQGKDRWVKLGFLAVIIIVAVVVYSLQQKPLAIDGWGTDLQAAMQQAERENRPVLAFFVRTPPSETADATKKVVLTKPENTQAMIEHKLIKVLVATGPDSDVAKTYKIEKLPTLLLLSPSGMELNRFDGPGHIGEVPFRENFLSPLAN